MIKHVVDPADDREAVFQIELWNTFKVYAAIKKD